MVNFKRYWYKFVYLFNIAFPFLSKIGLFFIVSMFFYTMEDYEMSKTDWCIGMLGMFIIFYFIPTYWFYSKEERKHKYKLKLLNKYQKRLETLMYKTYGTPTTNQSQTVNFDLMNGHDFEYFCCALLKVNGFNDVEVTRGSGDQGIDIIAYKDGIKYGIQCKCYSDNVGNHAVQEAYSGCKFYDCHVPVVMTNSYFTNSAKELAQKNNVLLWDRQTIIKFIR